MVTSAPDPGNEIDLDLSGTNSHLRNSQTAFESKGRRNAPPSEIVPAASFSLLSTPFCADLKSKAKTDAKVYAFPSFVIKSLPSKEERAREMSPEPGLTSAMACHATGRKRERRRVDSSTGTTPEIPNFAYTRGQR